MAFDWDALVLQPTMGIFGEGEVADQSTWPIYTPRGLPAFQLADAVFDRAYADVEIEGDDSGNVSRKPCLGVRVALFPQEPAENDKVFIPSVPGTFIVKECRLDGHGHARLILMGPTA